MTDMAPVFAYKLGWLTALCRLMAGVLYTGGKIKGKVIPLQAWCGPEGG